MPASPSDITRLAADDEHRPARSITPQWLAAEAPCPANACPVIFTFAKAAHARMPPWARQQIDARHQRIVNSRVTAYQPRRARLIATAAIRRFASAALADAGWLEAARHLAALPDTLDLKALAARAEAAEAMALILMPPGSSAFHPHTALCSGAAAAAEAGADACHCLSRAMNDPLYVPSLEASMSAAALAAAWAGAGNAANWKICLTVLDQALDNQYSATP